MKDLLKQYIEKGYEPAFYNKKINVYAHYTSKTFNGKVEKLELYLMSDWLEEKHGIKVDMFRFIKTWKILINRNILDSPKFNALVHETTTRTEALKSALEEAIKHI